LVISTDSQLSLMFTLLYYIETLKAPTCFGNCLIIIIETAHQMSWYKIYKGKAIPLQAWTGPEVSRRPRLPDFKTVGT